MTTYKPVDAPTITIHLDPKGRWSSYRFEFCNALEAVANRPNDPQPWSVLAEMGVHPVLDENGQERSSIVPGRA